MAKKNINYSRLGIFVLAGLAFLVLLLYVIGKNQNLFGKTFELKARFGNLYGLMPGNNVRFSGIDAGTVKSVEVLNDTTMEVTLLVKTKMKTYIHKNSLVSIGTDGFLGNRVVNIESAKAAAPMVEEGDVLRGTKGPNTDEMLKVLNSTNNDIASIVAALKQTVERINRSKAVWQILNDESMPQSIRTSLSKVKSASDYMDMTMKVLYTVVNDVKSGKGTMGKLLTDTAIAVTVYDAAEKIKDIGVVADSLSLQIAALIRNIATEVNDGKGTIHALLKDKEMAVRLNNTIKNIEQDTKAFNEVMDAVKQSFLFRGYFRKLEKQKNAQTTTGANLK
ncbi:MAG: MCE family protein [Chitinophagaceae bacterium]|nr:MAG: MCE family protein [Chitinophagaceae bacterium]